jgi:arginine repressor
MKNLRHSKIISLIRKYDIETQEELLDKLKKEGLNVTQATISRDIRDLKLTKAASSKGEHRYVFKQSSESFYEKYIRILKEGLLSVEQAQNLVVIKTVAGMAMAVAAAVDALELGEVIGCIAGDDTIMCATKGNEEALSLIDKIKELM